MNGIICAGGNIAGYGEVQLLQSTELLQQHDCIIVAGNHDQSIKADAMGEYNITLEPLLKLVINYFIARIEKESVFTWVHVYLQTFGMVELNYWISKERLLLKEMRHGSKQQLAGFDCIF